MTLMTAMICMNVPELALYDRNHGFQKRFDNLQYVTTDLYSPRS